MQPIVLSTTVLLLLVSQAVASSSSDQAASPSSSSSVVSQPQASVGDVSSPVQQQAPQVASAVQPVSSVVVEQSSPVVQPPQQYHPSMSSGPMVSQYAPAGLIQVVGNDQQVVSKQQQQQVVGRSFGEQYGQPEPSALPPGYKPFGSWGLYIGGNPADGYYTNYYKALANTVDKQQVAGVVEPQSGASMKPVVPAGQVAPMVASGPMYKQAISSSSSSPYVGSDYYPFAYSPSDLNSGASPVHPGVPMVVAQPASSSSAVVTGPQVSAYSGPMEQNSHVLSYSTGSVVPEMYATKRLGSAHQGQKEQHMQQQHMQQQHMQQQQQVQQQQVAPPSPAKGYYRSQFYSYQPASQVAPAVVGQQQQVHQSHVAGPYHQHPHQHQQVVAYPVPVGSQMVGSQAGVDGAFAPYGVHAFTRYAVKPTMVSSADQGYYYSQVYNSPAGYKQQAPSSVVPPAVGYGQPMNFYGYPMHYSAGPFVAEHQVGHQQQQQQHNGQVAGSVGPQMSPQVEAASSEKSESEVNKQQQHKSA